MKAVMILNLKYMTENHYEFLDNDIQTIDFKEFTEITMVQYYIDLLSNVYLLRVYIREVK